MQTSSAGLLPMQGDILASWPYIAYNLITVITCYHFTKTRILRIRGHALEWFRSCLDNRLQFVEFTGTRSSLNQLHYGVPQGSVLCPLLFIIYIND